MVNYESDTTTSNLINYRLKLGPSTSAIYLCTDSEAQQALMRLAEDPSKLKEKSLFLNRQEGDDDNSTIHVASSVAEGEDRIVGGVQANEGDLPMKARLITNFTNGAFL